MDYIVQKGDTIAEVSKRLGCLWKDLKEANPKAVGQSRKNGNWFLREGMTVSVDDASFAKELGAAANTASKPHPSAQISGEVNIKNGQEIIHAVQAGETIWGLATQKYGVDPDALQQFNQIDDPRRLQIGQTLRIPERLPAFQPADAAIATNIPNETDSAENAAETTVDKAAALTLAAVSDFKWETARAAVENAVGKAIKVVASWYGQYHHGRAMANGEPFNMYAATIAHKDLPLGAKVRLENPETGEKVVATVTDRGPFIEGRDVDLSYGVAKRLSLDKQGVGSLLMTVL
ncbi:MAG: septal ring lytic transglycosylase RlpA family protein [Desulfobulbaceae bacterium]|jgi:rare lipoprotein A|nr:septal ring lytic transglycosylase RlpA family protein [Desulfobulbaceae bacterium]